MERKTTGKTVCPSGTQYAMGFIPVPSKYIFWAELVLIQLITPNVSFVGHLAGILVGLLYTKGPLKVFMDSFLQSSEHRRFYGGGYSTANDNNYYGSRYNTRYRNDHYSSYRNDDYNNYTGGLSEEEQMRRAQEESLRDGGRMYPDLDDLRRKRAGLFS